MFNNFFFEQRVVYGIIWKNIAELGRPHMIYGACAFHAGYRGLQTQTFGILNTFLFSTAAMVARMRLKVYVILHCLPCFYYG
jgi:hypothetical protein